jgi:hypothetical protein
MTHNYQTATILRRFIAYFIDTLLKGAVISAFLLFAMGKSDENAFVDEGKPSLADEYQFFAYADGIVNGPNNITYFESFIKKFPMDALIGLIVLPMLYYVLFESLFGGTIGKLLTGIRVRRKDGGKISFFTAVIRFIGRIISTLIFMLGYVLALFDKKHQALHDKIANTLVLKRGTGI